MGDIDSLRDPKVNNYHVIIHGKKKDGGCTFYHNTVRTKISPLGILKDTV